MTQSQEMSMDEILSSIRKIISEDKKPERKKVPVSIPFPDKKTSDKKMPKNGDSPVLDLKNQIQPDGSVQVLQRKPFQALPTDSSLESSSSPQCRSQPNTPSMKKPELLGANKAPESLHAHKMTETILGVAPTIGQVRTNGCSHAALPPVPSAATGGKPSSPHRGFNSDLLMSKETISSANSILEKAVQNPEALLSLPTSDNVLENLVQKGLEPLLRSWMDTYFSALVERIVREQVRILLKQNKQSDVT